VGIATHELFESIFQFLAAATSMLPHQRDQFARPVLKARIFRFDQARLDTGTALPAHR
jgi:hypothetical protein